eukprot:scaffold14.g1083.t1
MVQLLEPSNIWWNLAQLCFLSAALWWDVLLVRASIFCAQLLLLVFAALGSPRWGHVSNPGYLSLEGVICIQLAFHGLAIARLLWDERRVALPSPEAEALWRYFLRRGGMGRLEFLETWRRCRLERVAAGEPILRPTAARRTFAILIDGVASYEVGPAGALPGSRAPRPPRGAAPAGGGAGAPRAAPADIAAAGLKHSGDCFEKGLLGVLGVFLAFEKGTSTACRLDAKTDCLVAFWDVEQLNQLAVGVGPAVAAAWRNYALCQLGLEYWHLEFGASVLVNARGQAEPPEVLEGTARSTDFTDPLSGLEVPHPPRTVWGRLRAGWLWLYRRLGPFVPPGLRHMGLPATGVMARQRVQAVVKAADSEGLCRGDSDLQTLIDADPAQLFAELSRRWSSAGEAGAGGAADETDADGAAKEV